MKQQAESLAPAPLLRTLPPAPMQLTQRANEIYQTTGELLCKLEFLKASDLNTLCIYANEVATYETCSRMVWAAHDSTSPDGFVVTLPTKVLAPNLYRKLAAEAEKKAAKLAASLCLTPESRRKAGGYWEASISGELQKFGAKTGGESL